MRACSPRGRARRSVPLPLCRRLTVSSSAANASMPTAFASEPPSKARRLGDAGDEVEHQAAGVVVVAARRARRSRAARRARRTRRRGRAGTRRPPARRARRPGSPARSSPRRGRPAGTRGRPSRARSPSRSRACPRARRRRRAVATAASHRWRSRRRRPRRVVVGARHEVVDAGRPSGLGSAARSQRGRRGCPTRRRAPRRPRLSPAAIP